VGAAYEYGQKRKAEKEMVEVEMFHRPGGSRGGRIFTTE
jgi:hypothetical protein